MNRKTTYIAAASVLLIGLIAIPLVVKNQETRQNAGRLLEGENAGEATSQPARTSSRSKREVKNKDLVEEYGQGRTNLARHISESLIDILDCLIQLDKNFYSNPRKKDSELNAEVSAVVAGLSGITLSGAQLDQAKVIYYDHRVRGWAKGNELMLQLRADPSELMAMVLAGDAHFRGDLGDEEYAELQAANAEALGGSFDPVRPDKYIWEKSPMEDNVFRRDFATILDTEQADTFKVRIAENEGKDESRQLNNNIKIPPINDLDLLYKFTGSTRQMLKGERKMAEILSTASKDTPKKVLMKAIMEAAEQSDEGRTALNELISNINSETQSDE